MALTARSLRRHGILGSSFSPLAPFATGWVHRKLIMRLARREIEARYRGSLLGLLWAVLTPLFMLAIYTFVFSVVFQSRWQVPSGGRGTFALILFAGLLAFNLVADCLNRAPTLILENPAFVKKIVFPLEILPWVALLSASFNLVVGTAILVVASLILLGGLPWTVVLLPLVLVPVAILSLACMWFISAIGVFLRDLRPLVLILTNILMFLSPLFYPLSALPANYQGIVQLNPLTFVLEQVRRVVFWGAEPDWAGLGVYCLVTCCLAWLGFIWFSRIKTAFADVL